jgi:hypothetical protein
MTRTESGRARQTTFLDVPIGRGQSARLVVLATYGSQGQLLDLSVPQRPLEQMSRGERIALALVQQVAEQLRRGGCGIAAQRDRADALLGLLETLEDLEARDGPTAARALRDSAA